MGMMIPHTLLVMGYQISRLSKENVLRFVHEHWREYRRRQYLLARSYRRHPMACGVPSRVWRRHSALLTLMEESEQNKQEH